MVRKKLTQAEKDNISKKNKKAWALRKAREEAFAKKDTPMKRAYKRHMDVTPVQMQSMVTELEAFILRIPKMKASEYLEARETLIKTILLRGV